jgi:hypothetical protein
MVVRCTEACLDPKLGQYSRHLTLVDLRMLLRLAPFRSPLPAPRDLAHMQITVTIN